MSAWPTAGPDPRPGSLGRRIRFADTEVYLPPRHCLNASDSTRLCSGRHDRRAAAALARPLRFRRHRAPNSRLRFLVAPWHSFRFHFARDTGSSCSLQLALTFSPLRHVVRVS